MLFLNLLQKGEDVAQGKTSGEYCGFSDFFRACTCRVGGGVRTPGSTCIENNSKNRMGGHRSSHFFIQRNTALRQFAPELLDEKFYEKQP